MASTGNIIGIVSDLASGHLTAEDVIEALQIAGGLLNVKNLEDAWGELKKVGAWLHDQNASVPDVWMDGKKPDTYPRDAPAPTAAVMEDEKGSK